MARIEFDPAGVSAARETVRGDPAVLRAVADTVAAAAATARQSLGPEGSPLTAELDRFRLVHAHLIDAMAAAFTALGGDLDLAVEGGRSAELATVAALGTLTATGRPAA